ncbi:MAG TPA: hypothetical protein VE397_21485 [Stellaceae bacterium]|jgi:hypothetical protein|nr:hypothetical protein [Stellaceae bacterium]
MSNLVPLRTAASRLAVALALAVPLAPAAFAQESAAQQQMYHPGQYDAFGAQDDLSIAAARSANPAPVTAEQRQNLQSEYRAGEENAFTPGVTSAQPGSSAVASTVPMATAPRDVVGDHGPQDALANEIYQPGSRPPGW